MTALSMWHYLTLPDSKIQWEAIFRETIYLGGFYPGGIFQGGNFPRRHFSGRQFSGGNFLGDKFPRTVTTVEIGEKKGKFFIKQLMDTYNFNHSNRFLQYHHC